MKLNEIFENNAVQAVILALFVILITVLWHPWIDADFVYTIEDEINDKLGITEVQFRSRWSPLGMNVYILGRIEGVGSFLYIGDFFIDVLGNTDVIHTKIGDIPAWW